MPFLHQSWSFPAGCSCSSIRAFVEGPKCSIRQGAPQSLLSLSFTYLLLLFAFCFLLVARCSLLVALSFFAVPSAPYLNRVRCILVFPLPWLATGAFVSLLCLFLCLPGDHQSANPEQGDVPLTPHRTVPTRLLSLFFVSVRAYPCCALPASVAASQLATERKMGEAGIVIRAKNKDSVVSQNVAFLCSVGKADCFSPLL